MYSVNFMFAGLVVSGNSLKSNPANIKFTEYISQKFIEKVLSIARETRDNRFNNIRLSVIVEHYFAAPAASGGTANITSISKFALQPGHFTFKLYNSETKEEILCGSLHELSELHMKINLKKQQTIRTQKT
jgi:hypothetical protein